MKEEALKIGGELLNKMPGLKTRNEVRWKEKGVTQNFIMLCALLKGNAIPTKKLNLNCDDKIYKNEITMMKNNECKI